MTQQEKEKILFKLRFNLKSMLYSKTRIEYERFYHVVTGIESVIDCLPELKDEAHQLKATIHNEFYEYQRKKGLI